MKTKDSQPYEAFFESVTDHTAILAEVHAKITELQKQVKNQNKQILKLLQQLAKIAKANT